jgi:hypothetical protein
LNVPGLNFLASINSFAYPSNDVAQLKTGFEYNNAYLKMKSLVNVRDFTIEDQLTYQFRHNAIFGCNFVFNTQLKQLTKHEIGVTLEPTDKLYVGLRHESANAAKVELGKFFLIFSH